MAQGITKDGRNFELSHIITSKEKTEEYVNGMCDYYIRASNVESSQRSELQVLYDAAEGILDDDSYKYVTNPMNTEEEAFKRFPAKLRNYDIIKPIIQSFVGETSKRPTGATVIIGNSDASTKRKEALTEEMSLLVAQGFVNQLNQMGIPTGVASQPEQDMGEAQAKFEEEYDDVRAILGQNALDYIQQFVNIDAMILELMYDWVVAGRIFTFKEARNNDVYYKAIDPRDIAVLGWGNNKNAEDAEAIVVAFQVTGVELLAKFFEEIGEHNDKEEILKYIDQSMFDDNTFSTVTNMTSERFEGNSGDNDVSGIADSRNITLYHTVWNTITKAYILHYYDDFGGKKEMMVDDTYKLDKDAGDIELEELIVREWYENYRLDDRFHLGGGRGAVQRHMINNMATCKLPYNGTRFGYRLSSVDSKVKQMIPYQVLYNIFHYRWELLLAKNKDKIMALPQGMIPSGDGWDEDKFFYFMEALGFMVYDETAPNAHQFIQGIKAIDMSLGNAMDKMWQNLLSIKEECWDLIGMNRQRYGATYASDGKATNEQAVAGASTQTAPMFFQFDKFMESDYEGLLDASKVAYIDGKKVAYINSDGKTAWFEMNADEALEYMESEFNVFARNSTFEQEKVEKAQNMLLTLGQNGTTSDTLLELLDANSIAKMKRYVKEGLSAEREFQQSLEAQKTEQAQTKAQSDQAIQDGKNATDIRVAEIQAAAKRYHADATKEIASLSDLADDTAGMETEVDTAGAQASISRKEDSRRKGNALADSTQLKRENNANALAIAKENRNQYDK